MGDTQCNGHSDRQNHMSGSNNNSINTTEFIDYVHYLIEQCLVKYMSKKEAVEIISQSERVDPELTTLVWQKLEEDNPEFFAVYNIMLNLKLQIVTFNHLLEKQITMMSFPVPSMLSAAPMQKTTHSMPLENSFVRQLQQPASALAPEHWYVAAGGQSAPCIAPESFHHHTHAQSEPVPTPVSMDSNHNFTMDTSKARVMNKDALVNDANFMSLLENLPQLHVTPRAANGNTRDHSKTRSWTPGVTDPPEDLHYGEGSTELNDNHFPSIMEPSIRDNLFTTAECDDIVSEFLVEEPQMHAQNGEVMDPQQ